MLFVEAQTKESDISVIHKTWQTWQTWVIIRYTIMVWYGMIPTK